MQKTVADTQSPSIDLVAFARNYGPSEISYQGAELSALSGDAGFRRYYRLSSSPSLMMVDSPPKQEKNLEYVQVSDLLASNGVAVPHIHAVGFESGVFILEDLGNQLLQTQLGTETAAGLYDKALRMLLNMQRIEDRPDWAQDYSREKLLEEMSRFPDWFVEQLLGVSLDASKKRLIKKLFAVLAESAQEQPQVFVHRDFHCRNLMLVSSAQQGCELKTIDFQDAVWGPISYDLISLCRDCYVRWNPEKVEEIIKNYGQNLVYARLLSADQARHLPRWADWMGLQRHIKVLGTFSRLYLRDKKSGYLQDLPLVLRYTLEVLASYSDSSGPDYRQEFADFYAWLSEELVPLAENQAWYQDWRTAGDYLEF